MMDIQKDNAQAELMKAKGTEYFKQCNYAKAVEFYTQAIDAAEEGISRAFDNVL